MVFSCTFPSLQMLCWFGPQFPATPIVNGIYNGPPEGQHVFRIIQDNLSEVACIIDAAHHLCSLYFPSMHSRHSGHLLVVTQSLARQAIGACISLQDGSLPAWWTISIRKAAAQGPFPLTEGQECQWHHDILK